jgi:6-phosphogluconolactonase (cycloisomerase 2 family)
MAVDEEKQLIYMSIQSDNKIEVYRKQASGVEKPVRTIEGNDTQLEDPHGIAIDFKNNLIYVSNFGNGRVEGGRTGPTYGKFDVPSITVYPLNASGNTKPLRIIEGPATLMNWPSHMAFHEERQELFVANDADSSILVFRATEQGNAAPIRVIKGPKTESSIRPELPSMRNWANSMSPVSEVPSVTVFPVTANGDACAVASDSTQRRQARSAS